MVAECYRVRASLEDLAGHGRGYAASAGAVLGVDDDGADAVQTPQALQLLPQHPPPGASHDVAYHDNTHLIRPRISFDANYTTNRRSPATFVPALPTASQTPAAEGKPDTRDVAADIDHYTTFIPPSLRLKIFPH